ncbi:MFS transporter [Ramlibacter sp.]|uniref:MFS transporter n=1 Tax=Ramlibacter sp. TaxID=1917967 RepID=UPI002C778E38|nr:MFS transporter [Ramlibacter sp.]HWI84604.1 MFS transporter [Ramlibacter sp.]
MPFREAVRAIPLRLICLLVLGHVAFAGNRFTLTLQAVALHASPLSIGILMSLLMVVPMVLSVHMGRWADRLGFARPAACGLAALALGSLIGGLLGSMPALYVASVLIGTGYTMAHVAVQNAVGQLTPARQLTHSFSVLAMGFSLSGMTGPLVAGVVIDHLGHAAAFLGMLLFAAVSLALLAPFMQAGAAGPDEGRQQAPGSVMGLLRHPPLRAVLIVSGLLTMAWDMFQFLAPLHGARTGLSATLTGTLMGAFGAGTFAIRLLLPLIHARMSEWRILSWALFVAALCYTVFPLAGTLPLMLAAAFAMGLSVGCGTPMAMSLLHLTAPPARAGEAVGVRTSIVSASQTLFPLVFGALGSAMGVASVFWAGATVLASGGAFARRRTEPVARRP